MGRIITVVLTLGALSFLIYHQVANQKDPQGASQPKRQLDNVREAAKQIEVNDQQHVDDVFKKSTPE
jgi:hypothetical protein